MPPPEFDRPEHRVIARALRMSRADLLLGCECWFGGGTAVVMKHGEYRLSLDVDFKCSSREGYSALRTAVLRHGAQGVFDGPIRNVRDFRVSHEGLRSLLELDGQLIRFEIVREARIDLSGAMDTGLGCPTLSVADQCAEKLLANSHRGIDPHSSYRDLIDLGILALANGRAIPGVAIAKASQAYPDVLDWVRKVISEIREKPRRLTDAANLLRMDAALARRAVAVVARQVARGTPGLGGPGTPGGEGPPRARPSSSRRDGGGLGF